MFSLFTNLLEPVSFLIYFLAFAWKQWRQPAAGTWVLLVFYGIAALLHFFASMQVFADKNNIWVYDLTLVLATIATGAYFYLQFYSSGKRRVVLLLTATLLLYNLLHSLLAAGPRYFDSLGYALLSVMVCSCAFLFFRQVFEDLSGGVLYHRFNFWLVTGYICYYLGAFLIFLTYYYFTKKVITTYTHAERELTSMLWGVHNSLLFLGAALTLTGSIWTIYRKKLPSS